MSGSNDLYAFATYYERSAEAVPLIEGAEALWRMPPGDWQKYLEAKARMYGRAADAARELEDRS